MRIFTEAQPRAVKTEKLLAKGNEKKASLSVPLNEKIKGEILDLKQTDITILLETNEVVKGRLINAVLAQIGQQAEFILKAEGGEILMQMISGEVTETEEKLFSDLLKTYGFKASPENIKMLKIMVENEMPLNKEEIIKFNQAVKLVGTENTKKALFLIDNGIKTVQKNAEILDKLTSGEFKLPKELGSLLYEINSIEDVQQKLEVFKLLNLEVQEQPQLEQQKPEQPQSEESVPLNQQGTDELDNEVIKEQGMKRPQIQKSLPETELPERAERKPPQDIANKPQKFVYNFLNTTNKDINKFIRELAETLEGIKKTVSKEDKRQDSDSPVKKRIDDIENTLKFTSEIKSHTYTQLPLMINGHQTEAELFVFHDKKNKKSKNNASASALIALDLSALGRLEAYVYKNGGVVSCQFKTENDYVESLVRGSLDKLNQMLDAYNYKLDAVMFKKLEEPFTLLDPEPVLEETEFDLNGDKKRIMFDMRA